MAARRILFWTVFPSNMFYVFSWNIRISCLSIFHWHDTMIDSYIVSHKNCISICIVSYYMKSSFFPAQEKYINFLYPKEIFLLRLVCIGHKLLVAAICCVFLHSIWWWSCPIWWMLNFLKYLLAFRQIDWSVWHWNDLSSRRLTLKNGSWWFRK